MSAVRTGTVVQMHAVLVVNPFATRVTQEKLARVVAALTPHVDVTVKLTERRGHATELVA